MIYTFILLKYVYLIKFVSEKCIFQKDGFLGKYKNFLMGWGTKYVKLDRSYLHNFDARDVSLTYPWKYLCKRHVKDNMYLLYNRTLIYKILVNYKFVILYIF